MLETIVLGQTQSLADYAASTWHIFLAVMVFSVLIFVHELGHFVMARLVGIRVETFALGFGPRIVGFKRGSTDFCIRAFPFGGYVKMLGQEDAALDQERVMATKSDPESFLAKSPGQRMAVVSGGVLMNLLCAAIAFIIVFMNGLEFNAPVAGKVRPGSPAEKAGVRPGDVFVEINGQSVLHFGEIMTAIALSDPSRPVDLILRRNGETIHTQAEAQLNSEEQLRQIGVGMPTTLEVMYAGLTAGGGEQLRPGDVIVKVGSEKPEVFEDVVEAMVQAKGRPVELTVNRAADGEETQLKVVKRAYLMFGGDEGSIVGLLPRCKVLVSPENDTYQPDSELLQGGDVIVRAANVINPSWLDLMEYFESVRGDMVTLEVIRNGERREVTVNMPKGKKSFRNLVGELGIDDENPIVAGVVPGSGADELGVARGSKIVACAGQQIKDWRDLIASLQANAGETVEMAFQFGDDRRVGQLTVPREFNEAGGQIRYAIDMLTAVQMTTVKGKYPHQAVALGVRQTWDVIKMVYVMLKRVLIDRSVGAKKVGGPIFILQAGKRVAEEGINHLLYYLALISANLAVVNFLPLPVLDGGAMLILMIEKVRGKGLSARATTIWQSVGLGLICALLLFVTYNDIMRWITGDM